MTEGGARRHKTHAHTDRYTHILFTLEKLCGRGSLSACPVSVLQQGTYVYHGESWSAERAGMKMQRSCAANSGPTRCADGRWLASGGVGRLFLNIVEVGGEKARCGVPKLASSGMHATGSRETHSHEAKSRWDRGWWIMMDDDHGFNQNPRVGRGRNRFPAARKLSFILDFKLDHLLQRCCLLGRFAPPRKG